MGVEHGGSPHPNKKRIGNLSPLPQEVLIKPSFPACNVAELDKHSEGLDALRVAVYYILVVQVLRGERVVGQRQRAPAEKRL